MMKKILLFLFIVFIFGPSLQAKEVLGRNEEIRELREKIQQLEVKIEELAIRPCPPEPAIRPCCPPVERRALALPDISVVGDIVGTFSEDKDICDRNKIVVRKIELALQGYLWPGIRADVFASLCRHGGEYKAKICEAYISFLETPVPGLSIRAGKQLLDFGRLNPRHAHHWDFVDRPMVLDSFLGCHGAAGQGVAFSYLLPLPFFVQWDVGAWHIDKCCPPGDCPPGGCPPACNHGHHHCPPCPDGLAEETYSTRLWTSFALAEDRELGIGLSGLRSYDGLRKDRVTVGGLDVTYQRFGPGPRRWLFENELLFLDREVQGKDKDRWGFYSFLNYRWDRLWCVGLRYDWMETPGGCQEEKSSISGILTHRLTCTTFLRFQHQYDLENNNHTAFLQVSFGIGPHAHPLD